MKVTIEIESSGANESELARIVRNLCDWGTLQETIEDLAKEDALDVQVTTVLVTE